MKTIQKTTKTRKKTTSKPLNKAFEAIKYRSKPIKHQSKTFRFDPTGHRQKHSATYLPTTLRPPFVDDELSSDPQRVMTQASG